MLNLENFSRVIPPDPLAGRARPRLRNPRPGIHPPLIFCTPQYWLPRKYSARVCRPCINSLDEWRLA